MASGAEGGVGGGDEQQVNVGVTLVLSTVIGGQAVYAGDTIRK